MPRVARYAIFAVAASHAVMASVMAMTPVHLTHVVATNVTVIIGVTIALHVGGMYGLAPVFGILADRWGRLPVILSGQVMLAASLTIAAIWGQSRAGNRVRADPAGSGLERLDGRRRGPSHGEHGDEPPTEAAGSQ